MKLVGYFLQFESSCSGLKIMSATIGLNVLPPANLVKWWTSDPNIQITDITSYDLVEPDYICGTCNSIIK